MRLFLILILLQHLTNILVDKTGISKKYFSSSGSFVCVLFCVLFFFCSFYIASDIAKEFFTGDFWIFLFWLPFFITIIAGCLLLFANQLIYSYLFKKILKKWML